MPLEVKIPEVGESITEGILAEWCKADGDWVEAEEPLLELETDKITMTVNAEAAGQLKILVPEGATVQVGQVVATIDTEAEPRVVPAGEKPLIEAEEAPQPAPEHHSPPPSPAAAAPLSPPAGMPQAAAKLEPLKGSVAGRAAHGRGAPPGCGGHRRQRKGRAHYQGGRGAPHRRASAAERAIQSAGVRESAGRPGRSRAGRGPGRDPGSPR